MDNPPLLTVLIRNGSSYVIAFTGLFTALHATGWLERWFPLEEGGVVGAVAAEVAQEVAPTAAPIGVRSTLFFISDLETATGVDESLLLLLTGAAFVIGVWLLAKMLMYVFDWLW